MRPLHVTGTSPNDDRHETAVFCGWCKIFVIVYALERNVKYHELLDINREKLHITRSDLSKVNKNMHHNTKFTSFLKVKKCMHGRSVQFIPDSQIDVWYLVPTIYLFFHINM